jgi:hypothetical protein
MQAVCLRSAKVSQLGIIPVMCKFSRYDLFIYPLPVRIPARGPIFKNRTRYSFEVNLTRLIIAHTVQGWQQK